MGWKSYFGLVIAIVVTAIVAGDIAKSRIGFGVRGFALHDKLNAKFGSVSPGEPENIIVFNPSPNKNARFLRYQFKDCPARNVGIVAMHDSSTWANQGLHVGLSGIGVQAIGEIIVVGYPSREFFPTCIDGHPSRWCRAVIDPPWRQTPMRLNSFSIFDGKLLEIGGMDIRSELASSRVYRYVDRRYGGNKGQKEKAGFNANDSVLGAGDFVLPRCECKQFFRRLGHASLSIQIAYFAILSAIFAGFSFFSFDWVRFENNYWRKGTLLGFLGIGVGFGYLLFASAIWLGDCFPDMQCEGSDDSQYQASSSRTT